MRDLNFSQAHGLTKEGYAVRRIAWRKWLTRKQALSWIYTPATDADPAEEHIVQHTEIAREEMLAQDWTDEPWDDGGGGDGGGDHWPPYVKKPGKPKRPPPGGGYGGGGNPPGPGGEPGPGPGPGGDPPPPGGSGPGGGPDPGPDARPAGAPTITVTVTPHAVLPGCYHIPLDELPATVELDVQAVIAGGPPGVGTFSVELAGTTIGGMTGWPGAVKAVAFPAVTFTLGGTVTATATYSIGGTPYTGTGDYTFPDECPVSSGSGGGGMI